MSVTRLILILFLIITGIFQVRATSYCASPFTVTATNGTSITLNLTCKQIDATHYVYQLDFSAAVTIPLYNPNIGVNTSNGQYIMNNSNLSTSNGNKTLYWTIPSTTTPTLFVNDIALYVGGAFGVWSLPTSVDFTAVCSTTPTANAGLPQSVCKNAPFTLGGSPSTALNGTAPYTYLWSSNPTSFSSTLANPTASLTTTTTYTVTVTDKNSATATSSVLITITTTAAAPTVSYNSPLQTGQTLNLSCSPAYSSYNWAGPNSFGSTLPSPTKTNMQPVNFGTYTVTVTDAYTCTNTGTVLVSIHTPATYYINDNTIGEVGAWCTAVGSDVSGTGSTSKPYATLNYLLSQKTLYGGDKVYIDIGTYNWATVDFSSGDDRGSSTSQLVINGAGATKTLIIASSGAGFNSTTSNNYITFQNLSISAIGSAFNWTSPQYIQILNCAISSNYNSYGAIYFNTSSNNNTISGNTISQINTSGSGIYFQGSPHKYNTISKNIIKGVNGSEPMFGIYFQTGTNNNLIVNDFIANFKYGLYQSTNYSTKIYNNSFYCNKYCFRGILDTMDIRNNIFYTYGKDTLPIKNYCIVTSFSPDQNEIPTIDNNIYYHPNKGAYCIGFYNSTYSWTFIDDWQGYFINVNSDANSFELDPLYKTQNSSDLHLASNLSPAFNAGVTISVTDDIDNESRPLGAAYDIGADEYNFALLPVKLISFNAFCMDGSVKINWATATETNNDYFILEKSIDAKNFIPLAHIKGAGNSNKMLNYSFNDNEPLPGNQYYRLTQVDYNGQKEIFNISNANCNSSISDSYKAYYYNGKIYITINSSTIEKMYIQLLDMTGRLVFSDLKQLNENTFTYNIPVEQLSKGIYILKLFNNNKKYLQKIIIK